MKPLIELYQNVNFIEEKVTTENAKPLIELYQNVNCLRFYRYRNDNFPLIELYQNVNVETIANIATICYL